MNQHRINTESIQDQYRINTQSIDLTYKKRGKVRRSEEEKTQRKYILLTDETGKLGFGVTPMVLSQGAQVTISYKESREGEKD